MLQFVQTVNSYLADYILIILLIGTGIYFTVCTRFVQIRCFGEGMKKVFGNFSLHGGKQHGGISSFQALTTAIAAQVGTGNIVGACGAILTGGPGAIFWMWIIAFLGMSTIYAEAVLAQKTREVDADGNVTGGPVYYIHKAFPNGFGRSLAGFFSVAIIIALGFMGCMVQSNSIAESCTNAFGIPGWTVGVIIAAVAALIFIGGVQRIAFVTEKLVPLMACLYLLGGLIILIARIQYLPSAIGMIFTYAFVPQAIIGGSVGAALKIAISQGAKRGLFSNEAGMGSTPHAHAMAKVAKPHDQGETAMIGVFIDTFIVLNMTALVILSSGVLDDMIGNGISGTPVAQAAFANSFGSFGPMFVAACLLFFAFSTIIGWYFFAESNVRALFGKQAVKPFALIVVICVFIGSILKVDLVWNLSDLFNGLMVLPNLIALLALNGIVAKAAGGADITED